ncbi:RHS repeat-associated core domain-containing protein [Cohnella sp. GCM10012308]|uniref:RHS repeat domain-containing protein n=1 Tax=Cohnella sp. GCM10012308 TaxID=3317329 RepID=UPI003619797B
MEAKLLRNAFLLLMSFVILISAFNFTEASPAVEPPLGQPTNNQDTLNEQDAINSTEVQKSPSRLASVEEREKITASNILFSSDTSTELNKADQLKQSKLLKPNERITAIQRDFTPLMLQIAAYFYPELLALLTKEQTLALLDSSTDTINQNIRSLTNAQLALMEQYAPIAMGNFDYNTNRQRYLQKHPQTYTKADEAADELETKKKSVEIRARQQQIKETQASVNGSKPSSEKVTALNSSPYTVTEFKNEYRYSVKTDGLVDDLYLTANRTVTDLSLSGKSGLDISLVRRYNSMDGKVLTPEYTAAAGSYTQQAGNHTSPIDIAKRTGYIAAGWSLNIPSMEKAMIEAEVAESHFPVTCQGDSYNNTGYCYQSTYYFQPITVYEKVNFTLDNGSSYEFRDGIIQNYPYQNVSYNKTLDDGKFVYTITLNGKISYKFDDQGRILTKSNQYGDQVVYTYGTAPNNDITITDSFGRIITIARNSFLVITGVTATLGGTVIKQLQYNVTQPTTSMTYRKWTTNGYQNVTENISYWQLNNIKDSTIASNIVLLEEYTYYPIDSTKLAAFNFKPDGYTLNRVGPNGEIVKGNGGNYTTSAWYWDNDSVPIESTQVSGANGNSYGEVPYLLLKQINFSNGLSAHFFYENYNTAWNIDPNLIQPFFEGPAKVYMDKYILQYVAYHPVRIVYYSYTENGTTKVNVDFYNSVHFDHGHNFLEYWKADKSQIARLGSTSRFGDKQTLKVQKYTLDDTYNESPTYRHYRNNGKDFVLAFEWAEYQNDYNMLSFTENDIAYGNRKHAVTAYAYEPNQLQPKEVYTYADDIPNYSAVTNPLVDANVQNPILLNISNKSTKIKKTFTYDSWGMPLTTTDELGNTTTNQYNGPYHGLTQSQVMAQDGASSTTTSYQYYTAETTEPKKNQLWKTTKIQSYKDPVSPLVTRTDTKVTENLLYNTNHLVTQTKTYGSGYQYGRDNTITQQDYTYTGTGQTLTDSTKVTLSNGAQPATLTNTYYYFLNGNLQKVIYPDNSYVEYEYDSFNRVTLNKVKPVTGNALITSVQYNNAERKVGVTLPDGELDETFYSPFGLELKSQRKINNVTRVTKVTLSNNGILPSQTLPYGESTLRTQYDYDSRGRLKMVTNGLGQQTRYFYSNFANKNGPNGYELLQNTIQTIAPDGKVETTYSDAYGRATKLQERNPNGVKLISTTSQYSSFGNLIQKDATSSGVTETTRYSYDPTGNLIFVKDSLDQTYQYVFNRFGNLIEKYTNGAAQATQKYVYNEVSWLLSKADATGRLVKNQYKNNGLIDRSVDKQGQTYIYNYNALNQVERSSIQNSTGNEIYWQVNSYDPLTHLQTGVSNSDNEALSYHYDMWKRNDTKTVAGRVYTFGYDAYDRMDLLTYPDGTSVSYQYDELNRIKSVNSSQTGIINYTYSTVSDNNKYILTYPGGTLKEEQQRDSFGHLVSKTQYRGSGTPSAEQFIVNGFGNITQVVKDGTSNIYAYDKLNRIKTISAPSEQDSYFYDAQGNRQTLETTKNADFESTDQTLAFNALNQLRVWQDAANGTTAIYTYYADGLRATKTVNGQKTRYVYVEGKIVEELDGSGNLKARNIWGNELLYRKDYTNNRAGYYLHNGHGDVVQIVDADGSLDVLKSYEYDIWGNIKKVSGNSGKPFDNSFGYTGELHDQENGYIYLRARYYDPTVGRFISEDTYEGELTNPLSQNLYTYVHNNPLSNIDPTGHYCASADGKIGHYGTCSSSTSMYMSDSDVNAILQASGGRANLNSIVSGSGIKWSEVKASLDSILKAVQSRTPPADSVAAMAGFTTDYGSDVVRRAITPFYSEVGSISGYSLNPVASKPYSALGIVSKVTTAGLLSVDLYGVVTDSTLSTGQKVGKAAIIATGTYVSYKIGSEVVWLSTTIGGPGGFAAGIILSGGLGWGISELQAIAIRELVM